MILATLIGVFITSAGIVIGADSAISDPNAASGHRAPKTCQPSARSAATLQGWMGVRASLHSAFHKKCKELRGSSQWLTLAAQADGLAQAIQSDLAAYLKHPRPLEPLPPFDTSHPLIAHVTVAGYEGKEPLVVARKLQLRQIAQSQWEPFVALASDLSFKKCGLRFHGTRWLTVLLMRDDLRLPAEDRRSPEVINGRRADAGDCSTFTPDAAKRLFTTATRITIDLGASFGIRRGSVGEPLTFVLIPPVGAVQQEDDVPLSRYGRTP